MIFAHGAGMLARHQGIIPVIIDPGMRDIASRINIIQPGDFQIVTDLEAAKCVPVARYLCRQPVGAQTDGDNHRRRIDPFAAIQRHATCLEPRDPAAEALFDPGIAERRIDNRARVVAEFRPDHIGHLDQDHLGRRGGVIAGTTAVPRLEPYS